MCVVAVAAGAWLSMVPVVPAFGATMLGSAPLTITTIAGDGQAGPFGDGVPAVQAELHNPGGVAEDLAGDLYIADRANNRIREVVNPTANQTDLISTVAGSGKRGFKGDDGPAARASLNGPSAVAVDSAGDLFIADTGNNRVREVLASGDIITVAGDGSCSRLVPPGNGLPAVRSSLCSPAGVAVAGSTLYISDTGHSEVRVVNRSGIIRDLAGTGRFGYSGDGGKATRARLGLPAGLAVTANHDVVIADPGDGVVREVLPSGRFRTFGGTGECGYSG